MGKFATNAIGAIWWSNLESICKWCIRWQNWQPMQVAPSGGQICNQFKKFHWNQFQTILVERFTQVMDLIPWVRCASSNVWLWWVLNDANDSFLFLSFVKWKCHTVGCSRNSTSSKGWDLPHWRCKSKVLIVKISAVPMKMTWDQQAAGEAPKCKVRSCSHHVPKYYNK